MNDDNGYKSGYVSIIGKPNVGKSTLLNRLVSEKIAATSDKPQTTRNKITGVCHFPEGQIILLDTPGIHKASSKMNRQMVKAALNTFNDVDVILFMIDVREKFCEEDEYVLQTMKGTRTPKTLVLNKIDLIPKPKLLPLIESLSRKEDFAEIVPVSALFNNGLDILIKVLLEHLPEGPRYFPEDMVTDCPEKFLVGELIREKIILLTRFELPYATAVVVESMKEGGNGVTVIDAVIFAEKIAQKKILIGQNGSMLKKIGSQARKEIEKFLGNKVYLNLYVKVKDKWRESDFYLREFGYP